MKAKNILLGLVGLFLLVLVYAPKADNSDVKEVQLCSITANDLKNKADYAMVKYFSESEVKTSVTYKSYAHEEGLYQYHYKVVGKNLFGVELTQSWNVDIEYVREEGGCIKSFRVKNIFKK